MKQFLNKIAVFFTLPLLCFLFLEWQVRTQENSYSLKMHNFHEKKSGIEHLILGNSHAYYGLNPAYFSGNTFNLANLSQSLDIDELLLNKNLADMNQLKTVILPISTFSFDFTLSDSEESWRRYDYLFYSDLNKTDLSISSFDLRNWSLVLAKGFKSNMDILLSLWKKGSLVNCSEKGWANNYKGSALSKDTILVKNTAERHKAFQGHEFENKNHLLKIIENLQNRGVRLILIHLPVSRSYFDYVDKESYSITQAYLQGVTSKYPHVEYVDWMQKVGFDTNLFYDPDHLNQVGAKKVSKLLDDYLKQ